MNFLKQPLGESVSLLLWLFGACTDASLVGSNGVSVCHSTGTSVEASETVDLGFSANDLRAAFGGEPALFKLSYETDSLGYFDDTVTFSDARDFVASRVSRTGVDCRHLHGENFEDVLQISWTSDLTTDSGDVLGTATVVLEANTLDVGGPRFSRGTNGAVATYTENTWAAFSEKYPYFDETECDTSVGWEGRLDAATWQLGAHCIDEDNGGMSGTWLAGTLLSLP